MLTKKILSLQHPLVLRWVNLVKVKSFREEIGSVIVTGKKLISELAQKSMLQTLITTDESADFPVREKFIVTEGILQKITGLQNPDGYAAEIPLPKLQDLSSCSRLLILDRIADPGNLGTLLRSAYALGWEGVVATSSTVDFFNDKALRAAKGATFFLPLACAEPEEIATWEQKLFIADIQGKPLKSSSFTPPFGLVLSSESKGTRLWPKGEKISIPMTQGAESLNVSAAGAILLYAMSAL